MSTKITHVVSILTVMVAGPAAAQGVFVPPAAPALPAFELFSAQPQPPRPPRPPQIEDRIRRGDETTENFSRTVRIGGNGTLDLSNLAGEVVVTGGGGDDVVINAVKRAYGGRSDGERRARLSGVVIEVREQANRVEVRTEYPRNVRNINVIVDYTVRVPQNASVFLRTVSGNVRATNVRGELQIESTSGDVEVNDARRLGQVRSVSGSITLNGVQSEADLALHTLSGDVTGQDVRARGITFNSVSGELRLTDAQTDRVDLRTMSGDISYAGQLPRNGRYAINTHSGDITLRLAAGGFIVEANTFSGDISTDFPVTLGGGTAGDGTRRRGPARTIRGTYGDGGAVLDLRSFSGDVVITRR